MKLRMIFFAILLIPSILAADTTNKVIYGEDDRLDPYEVTNSLYVDLAASTFAMIYKVDATKTDAGLEYKNVTLEEQEYVCSDERYSKQNAIAQCSGFLVGPDLLVTAGHCIEREKDCSKAYWVLDFKVEAFGLPVKYASADKVYTCKEIIETKLDGASKADYALIRLDRVVEGRTPLAVRTEGKIENGAELVVIGHPSGLPTKIADGAIVRKNNHPNFFVSNTDTFGGNSGSPVFDAKTGLVEGILVRGSDDYQLDKEEDCYRAKICKDNGCKGEDITRITIVSELMKILKTETK